MNREAISVSALNRYVKALLEGDEVLSQVWVEGELSGVRVHEASGHIYFRTVDASASVKAVMFRSYAQRLRFLPADGMKVLLNCAVTLYERGGDYQLSVRDIVPIGEGGRQTQLEELKERLEKEGLFAAERKRPLPARPRRVAVITSSSGAVIRDIQNVAGRRDPFIELQLYAVNVQGALAVNAILRAIEALNENGGADLAIIARGGGSKDDLWLFNDEALVRAAAQLKIPFISAVGHETDFTLLDFVADLRAPTPSAAAELAVPDLHAELQRAWEQLAGMQASLSRSGAQLALRLTDAGAAVAANAAAQAAACRDKLARAQALCDSLSPLRVLERGFLYATKDGKAVRGAVSLKAGDRLSLTFRDGSAGCTIDEVSAQ